MTDYKIEHWDFTHPSWSELVQIVANEQQTAWFVAQNEWHHSSHILVALKGDVICGFLRFITQVIGVDSDCDPVLLNGVPLIEAKILAFGVQKEYRRQGVGRSLQTHALNFAAQLHCYQLRSHSSGGNSTNHQLKLSMGFGVHPIIRDDDRRGVYFIMP